MRWIRAHRFAVFAALCAVLNLALYGGQAPLYLYGAPADDGLMIRMATALTRLDWLGAYNELTLSKGCFYPLWVVFLNFLNIPLPLGTQALYLLSCLAVICALRPLIRSELLRGCLFVLLLFQPAQLSSPLLRIYRDAITPALCMFLVAWVVGVYARSVSSPGGLRPLMPYVLCGIFALPAWWFVREDAFWMLPLIVCGLGLTAWALLHKRVGLRSSFRFLGVSLLPFGSLLLCGLLLAGMNLRYYGRFVINDYASGEFAAAYGALTRIAQEPWQPRIPVNEEVRRLAYAESPAFAELAEYLDGDMDGSAEHSLKYMGQQNDGVYDYDGGHLFWAIRMAVASLGYYESPAKAAAYFDRLEGELTQAFAEGRLPARTGPRESLSAPFDSRYIEPTLRAFAEAVPFLIGLRGMDTTQATSVQYGDADIMEYREVERLTNSNFLLDTDQYPLRMQVRVDGYAQRDNVQFRIEDASGKAMTLFAQNSETAEGVFVLLLEGYRPAQDYVLYVQEGDQEALAIPLRDYGLFSSETLSAQVQDLSVYGQVPKGEKATGTDWIKAKINAVLLSVYRIATPVLVVAALLGLLLTLALSVFRRFRRKSRPQNAALQWVAAGVLLMVAARLLMLSFVSVSAFDAVTVLYLSSTYPLLFLFAGLGIAVAAQVFFDVFIAKAD